MPYRNNRDEIYKLLSQHPTDKMTIRYITKTLGMKTHVTWSALETLVRDGYVTKHTSGKYIQYHFNSPYMVQS